MKHDLHMEVIDMTQKENRVLPLCHGVIPGSRPYHHTIVAGSETVFAANTGYYHILILIGGEADFVCNGETVRFDERVTFVPGADQELTVKALTDTQILEIQWDIFPEDEGMLKEYGTTFPHYVLYRNSIQYIDRNKSEKTISRMMIPHKVIPRFSLGSVESFGYDLVKPHSHPMLDQFFFSFPENDMEVIIDDEKIPMKGDTILYIPLGSNHGVEVTGDRHMHYMWIDFLPDNEAGLKRLDERHKPTGTVRDLEKEDKFRDNDK